MSTISQNPFIIYGCGAHARSIADVAWDNGRELIIFVDPAARKNENLFGYEVTEKFPNNPQFEVVIGIGDNKKRALAYYALTSDQLHIGTLIARDAYVSREATLQGGVFVAHGAHIGPNAIVNVNTILNTNCVVEHDVHIGKHCHISINATVAGSTRLGDFVMLGASATIIDKIEVCSNVIIGAGAVVVDNIAEPGTYVGVPARKICNQL